MIYKHEEFGTLEVVEYNNKPMFYANDVAKMLGYTNTQDGRKHCKSLKKLKLKETKALGLKSNGNNGNFLIGVDDLKTMVAKCALPNTSTVNQWLGSILPTYPSTDTVFIRSEHVALDTIEQLLGVTLIRQYKVLDYRIDGYHMESNTAYEIDEEYHSDTRHQKADITRQKAIEDAIGCKFVRIKV